MTPELSRRIGLALCTHVVTAAERATLDAAVSSADVEKFADMDAEARDLLVEIEARKTVMQRLDETTAA